MQPDEIQALVAEKVPDSEVQVGLDGNHVSLLVISPAFAGMSPVKKQQLVYSALSEPLDDGRIHAVHMKTLTPEQWHQQQ